MTATDTPTLAALERRWYDAIRAHSAALRDHASPAARVETRRAMQAAYAAYDEAKRAEAWRKSGGRAILPREEIA